MTGRRDAFFGGIKAISPILLGVTPFALIAGISAINKGFSELEALGMSVIVFAGAAQLAVVDLIGQHASAAAIIFTALIINLRFSMYSASIAPHFNGVPLPWRGVLAYLLTDQAYAVSIATYGDRVPPSKSWFFFGAAITLWVIWQAGTAVGIFLGTHIPPSWSLDFAIPLTFLALLFPTIRNRPSVVAAVTAGLLALVGHNLPYNLGLFLASFGGIGAGCMADWRIHRAA